MFRRALAGRKSLTAHLAAVLAISLAFSGPPLACAEPVDGQQGALLGLVTDASRSAAVERAVVHLRNPVTDQIYSSAASDDLGVYVLRGVPYGTYEMAVETEQGFFLTPEAVVVSQRAAQILSVALEVDAGKAAEVKSASFWKRPLGIVLIAAGAVVSGLVVSNQREEENAESPANP